MNASCSHRAILPGAVLLLLVSVTVTTAGCARRPQRVPVTGRVVIDGKPLTHGLVRFVPDKARVATGNLDDQGRFQLSCFAENDGTVLGPHKIEVAASEITGENTAVKWHAPKEYADIQTSGLAANVSGPTSDLVIELTAKGPGKSQETPVGPSR